MRTLITGGTILTPHLEYQNARLVIDGEKIEAIITDGIEYADGEYDQIINADGMWVTPGLIDIHSHGANGFDTMDGSVGALQGISQFLASHGVTSCLPTTLTASKEDTQKAIDNIVQSTTDLGGARVFGIHLEGPYLNSSYKGAQPEQHLRAALKDEYLPWLQTGLVKLITVAPEIEGVLELIEMGQQMGVEFSVGHSGASYEEMQTAADAGLRQATHTFNGMLGLHHRNPGTVGAVLSDDRIFTQIIADGIHLHPAVVKLIVQAKGVDKVILISDSMRAAGMEDGEHQLGDHTVIVCEGVARIASGSLAGSTLTMDAAVRNTMSFTSLGFQQVLQMATSTPARAMNIYDQVGELKPGKKADVVLFDSNYDVQMVIVNGNIVYKKNKEKFQ